MACIDGSTSCRSAGAGGCFFGRERVSARRLAQDGVASMGGVADALETRAKNSGVLRQKTSTDKTEAALEALLKDHASDQNDPSATDRRAGRIG